MKFSDMKTTQMLTIKDSFAKKLKIIDAIKKKRLGKMTE